MGWVAERVARAAEQVARAARWVVDFETTTAWSLIPRERLAAPPHAESEEHTSPI